MDSEPFWEWTDARGRPAPEPQAWAPGWLKLKPDLLQALAFTHWQNLSLWRDGEALPLLLGAQNPQQPLLLAQWPPMSAGFCRLRLEHEGLVIAGSRYFVGARHLNQQQWLSLLTELRYRLPARLLLQTGSPASVPVRPAALAKDPDEELHILSQLLEPNADTGLQPGLLAALDWLRRHARSHPVLMGQWRPLARTRRLSPAQLGKGLLQADSPVWEPRASLSQNQPENRFVTGLVIRLEQRLKQLELYLLRSGQFRLEARATELRERLARHWHQHPLALLTPLWQPPEQARIMSLPGYGICLRVWRSLRQGYLPALTGQLELPLGDLALLYQHACLLQLADALLSWGAQRGWCPLRGNLHMRRGQALLRLERGDLRLELIPELSFSLSVPASSATRTAGLVSLSQTQRPDISLLLSRHGPADRSQTLAMALFETKFRSEDNRPLKADLDKLHAYRDAIRRADGSSIVGRAVLLYPGLAQAYLPALEAWQILPGTPSAGLEHALTELMAELFQLD